MIVGDFERLKLKGQRPSRRSNHDIHCHCMLYLGATASFPHHASDSKLDRTGSNSRTQKRKVSHTTGCKMCSDDNMSWRGQIETAIWGAFVLSHPGYVCGSVNYDLQRSVIPLLYKVHLQRVQT
jgi:hypothetical protein